MTADVLRLEFTADPAEFLDRAVDLLRAEPVRGTVVASVAFHACRDAEAAAPPADAARWWLRVHDGAGRTVGAAFRTPPYPPYLMDMPEVAARELAGVLHARGEHVDGVNGALPAARVCAEELARLAGRQVRTAVGIRLFELGRLCDPPAAPGAVRPATAAEADLVVDWFGRFHAEADVQAGRSPGTLARHQPDPDAVRRWVDAGGMWLHVDEHDVPVHWTAARPPSHGVVRLGPVYTPPDRRRHGYAAATVAAVSRRLVQDGVRVCLNTDLANPTSNALYVRLGFRPVTDLADHDLVPA